MLQTFNNQRYSAPSEYVTIVYDPDVVARFYWGTVMAYGRDGRAFTVSRVSVDAHSFANALAEFLTPPCKMIDHEGRDFWVTQVFIPPTKACPGEVIEFRRGGKGGETVFRIERRGYINRQIDSDPPALGVS